MKNNHFYGWLLWLALALCVSPVSAAPSSLEELKQAFQNPTGESAPWIFWYWMNGAVTKEGITADLEAMKAAGLEGACLMPIRDSARVKFMDNSVLQGTPRWWEMVDYSMHEADRLGLKMGMHICDGFALAGGPWVRPEQSMQKVVYSQTLVQGGKIKHLVLPQPAAKENYYRDIAVYALPVSYALESAADLHPKVSLIRGNAGTSDRPERAGGWMRSENDMLEGLTDGHYKLQSTAPLTVQYEFEEPFTARSLVVAPSGTNFQALRWTVQASDDGEHFRDIKVCVPARRGWQDTDAEVTYSLPETTARFFRFCWSPEGTEPGAEDLDAAKWKASLSVKKINLLSAPLLENYEGKTALVWRLSPRLDSRDIPASLCVRPEDIIDLSPLMTSEGCIPFVKLDKNQNWMILRIGHTSTGHVNDTGGGAKGLECDKFDADAVRWQFENWFGAVYKHVDNDVLKRVLVRMHSDSWECGSQNWTERFPEEFQKRRGYDLMPYLPLYAGIPIGSAELSEAVLYDVRLTIAELVNDVFFKTLHELSAEYGCQFSSESVAPTMLSDGMLHYSSVDIPMGEYWLDSPTHDKPNDMFDAVSAAHVYGKNMVQAEGFTQLRALWKEYPGMLKSLGDKNLALGMNKLFFHVFCLHPFPGKYPGMTLDGIGLYMQGNQTWWPYVSAWVDYFKRCQTMLQYGCPVSDIAVFSGENLPSRSVLPDKFVSSLPGLFGEERVASEAVRVRNEGQPVHETSVQVVASSNMITADLWTDPLRGYKYDAINRDALIRLAQVRDGRLCLPGGASYGVLVFPTAHPMAPDRDYMSLSLLRKIREFQQAGLVVLLPSERPHHPVGYEELARTDADSYQKEYDALVNAIWTESAAKAQLLPYLPEDFSAFHLNRDLSFRDAEGRLLDDIFWTHRRSEEADIYFIANPHEKAVTLQVDMRSDASQPSVLQIWNPLTAEVKQTACSQSEDHIRFVLPLEANQSFFIVRTSGQSKRVAEYSVAETELNPLLWKVHFLKSDQVLNQVPTDFDWKNSEDPAIRYYSGTAEYSTQFNYRLPKRFAGRVFLELDRVNVIARVRLNGRDCGIVWTEPFRVDVTEALVNGRNQLEISVANTWYNYSQAIQYGLIQDSDYWTNGREWDHDNRLSEPPFERLQSGGLGSSLKLMVETLIK